MIGQIKESRNGHSTNLVLLQNTDFTTFIVTHVSQLRTKAQHPLNS